MKSWPIFVSVIVAAAVGTMVYLGFWQLQRAEWKEGLLATYEEAADKPAIAYPAVPDEDNPPYFRESSLNCLEVLDWRSTSGRSFEGQSGWAHIATCKTSSEGPGAQIVAGWSTKPDDPEWKGGKVDGIIAPDTKHIVRLVVDEPIPGLQKSLPPSTEDIPNNHLVYAVQWFLFAFIALAIFVIALRGRFKQP